MKYRPDIDGLRAVAVLSVLFYHAGLNLFSGGFIGVDVFFVISGFLITKKIADEIRANVFSLTRFYERRIRRIFPALFTITIFTLMVGAWLFDAGSYLELGKSANATTLFRSNIHFWTQSGYFEKPSTLKPLLHMWSLSVEEQFYFFLPLLMILLFRFFRKRLIVILTILCGLFFGLNIFVLNQDPSAAFFLAHLRAWELLVGSLIALKSVRLKPHLYNILSLLGIFMILISVVFYSDETPFPGLAAGVPVIGAALIIYSGIFGNSFIGKILSTKPFVFIGKISYSLYLWHWPLIVFGKYYLIREFTALEILVWVGITFGAAILSWKFIETPFRSKIFLKRDQIFKLAGIAMGFTLVFGYAINHYEGFPMRFESTQEIMVQDSNNVNKESQVNNKSTLEKILPNSGNLYKESPADLEPSKKVVFQYSDWNAEWEQWKNCSRQKEDVSEIRNLIFCMLGDSDQTPTFIVWGDSHAIAFATAINIAAGASGESGYIFAKHGCLPLLGIDRDNEFRGQCYKFNNTVIEYLKKHKEIKTIILIGRWSLYADGKRYKTEEGDSITLIDLDGRTNQNRSNAKLFKLGLNRMVYALTKLNRKIVIVSGVPEVGYHVPTAFSAAKRNNRDLNEIIGPTYEEFLIRNKIVISVLDNIEKNYTDILMLDPSKILCDKQACKIIVDGKPLYMDDDHLSTFGSFYISDIFDPVFETMPDK